MNNTLRNLTGLLVCTVSLIGAPPVALASHAESMADLQAMVYRANDLGYICREAAVGERLAKGESYAYPVVLHAGNEYVIIAAGDSSTLDLDLAIYDESGAFIDGDDLPDALPFVEASPAWTGSFTVEVTMARGHGNANFAVCFRS